MRAPSTPVSLPCRLPPVRFHLSWYSVCFNARRRREELSSTSLIALESEVVGAGEEEEGRGYMAPKEEAGEDERLLKDLPGSSDKEGELRSVLDGLSFPHFCAYKLFCIFSFSILLSFLLYGNVYLCWVCSWKRISSFSFLILDFIYGFFRV